ncbi:unnamed protein product [Rhizoctonia solani]|nr:unnamed protein product [Rhizoctonia solani]
MRFERLGELDDISKAIDYESQAIAITPVEDPSLPDKLGNLGATYSSRFEGLGDLCDLEKSIEYISHAVALIPDDQPNISLWLAYLGNSYHTRFERFGQPSDLDKAIEYKSRGFALAPEEDPCFSSRLGSLATSLSLRSQCMGVLNDLDQAIEYESHALVFTPKGHPHFSQILANLAASHSYRFRRLGELRDIDKAIEYGSRALALTSDGGQPLVAVLQNIGSSFAIRFQRLGELADLEKAIEYESRALALTPEGNPQLPRKLHNLATSLNFRFQCLGELDDLEQAIQHISRALTYTPDDHTDMAMYLATLGVSRRSRFQLLDELSDIENAVECGSCALAMIPDDHPQSCLWQFNLGLSYCDYYCRSNNPSHLQDSLQYLRLSSKSPTGSPKDKFRHAHQWASLAAVESSLSCIEAYQTTIDLLPQFIWLGATTSQRYEDIKMTKTLAVDAAFAAIRLFNPSLALEWLEHARCIVWKQHLMLRSPLDQLQASKPSLAARLQTVAKQLHCASSGSQESPILPPGPMTAEYLSKQRHHLAKEYDQLLAQVRTLPGYEDFLGSISANRLVRAARNGPIVAIICHEDHCDALIVRYDCDVAHLPLPDFSAQKAEQARSKIEASLRRQGLRERGVHIRREAGDQDDFTSVLALLWYGIVKPVLDALDFVTDGQTDSLPHITWCLTGASSFLPLHAAGDYSQLRSRAFDYVICSYVPTLSALLTSTPSTLSCNSRVLAIAQQTTPGLKPLPGTAKELAHIKSHVDSNRVGYSQLIDAQATPSSVLDAMEQHDWVHLACHAHQNVNDPTKSGFFLRDGVLDLVAINRRSFEKKGLAFLSACQTATGDDALPDEAVHLASGMLMAGYSSVIATMWSVVDEDAPFVADKVYGELMKEGKLGNGEAGRALHNAVAGLRERVGEKEFGRWVPYIHIGS